MAQSFQSSESLAAAFKRITDARSDSLIDLSHSISDGLPLWPGDPHVFRTHVESSVKQDASFSRSFSMLEHYATHIDAPAHFVSAGVTVDQIAPDRLMGSAVVLDAREAAANNPDYAVDTGLIARWEAMQGPIPPRAIVLLRTGWASRWPDTAAYFNKDASGVLHFPGFGADAARALIERDVSGIGVDTMSVDVGRSHDFPVHQLALQAGLYNIENLADLSALPEAGAFLIAAPIKLQGGSGGPCRVFAILP